MLTSWKKPMTWLTTALAWQLRCKQPQTKLDKDEFFDLTTNDFLRGTVQLDCFFATQVFRKGSQQRTLCVRSSSLAHLECPIPVETSTLMSSLKVMSFLSSLTSRL